MATAVLENVNKFSYLGLRRRPTYNEIIGLIKENETLTGQLPNRDATFFKASNEGSFFDGLDSLEVLKEQQQRILQRQMQDLLLRQNVRQNGGTFHVERHRQNTPSSRSSRASGDASSSSSSTPISVGSDFGTLRVAGMQTELQERARQEMSRQQQTGDAHAEQTSQQARLPTLDSFLSNITSRQRMIRPLPIPRRQPETVDLTTGDVEEAQEQFFPEEMTTAREEEPKKSSKLMKNISFSTNISNWSEGELAFQLYIRGVDVNDPEISLTEAKKKGKGKGMTNRQYYREIAQNMIANGEWERRIEEQLLQSRITEYKNRNKPRGSRD